MKAHVNQIDIYYEQFGTGKPLVLLHGNGEDHHIFDALAAKLQQHFTLYAVDSRNHGQSEKTEDYAYDTMAQDVYALMGALHLSQAGIVGFSDGAIVGLLLAMQHPEMVSRMALLGVNLQPEDFTAESYQFVQQTFEQTQDPLFKMMLEQPDIQLDEVKNVQTPTLLIAAEHDIFKPESFEALAQAMPHARLQIMPGHDHDSYITGQDMLYPDLVKFFEA